MEKKWRQAELEEKKWKQAELEENKENKERGSQLGRSSRKITTGRDFIAY